MVSCVDGAGDWRAVLKWFDVLMVMGLICEYYLKQHFTALNLHIWQHDSFKDLDEFLNDPEKKLLDHLKGRPHSDTAAQDELQRLLVTATGRRIEARIDERLCNEADVLV